MPGRHARDQPLHSAREQIRHVIQPLLALADDGATPWYPSVFGRGISRQEHARGVWLVGSERSYAQGDEDIIRFRIPSRPSRTGLLQGLRQRGVGRSNGAAYDDVANFFEAVAYFQRRGMLEAESVWHTLAYPLECTGACTGRPSARCAKSKTHLLCTSQRIA